LNDENEDIFHDQTLFNIFGRVTLETVEVEWIREMKRDDQSLFKITSNLL